jgi:hypothetical protein
MNGIVYGEPGVGKTTLVASAHDLPFMRDVLFVSIEAGDMSIEHYGFDTIYVRSFRDFQEAYRFMEAAVLLRDRGNPDAVRRMLRKAGMDIADDAPVPMYRTAIIDSLSELQKYVMDEILRESGAEEGIALRQGKIEGADWGRNSDAVRDIVRKMRDLSLNVFFVMGDDVSKNPETGARYHEPNVPGKLSTELMGFVDFGGYMTAKTLTSGAVERKLWISPARTFIAKNRFRTPVRVIDEPTIAKLWEIRAAGMDGVPEYMTPIGVIPGEEDEPTAVDAAPTPVATT